MRLGEKEKTEKPVRRQKLKKKKKDFYCQADRKISFEGFPKALCVYYSTPEYFP